MHIGVLMLIDNGLYCVHINVAMSCPYWCSDAYTQWALMFTHWRRNGETQWALLYTYWRSVPNEHYCIHISVV